jgi:3-dehydroquinate dehydratase-2
MDRWCRDFDNWGICDTVCFKLFDQTPHAWSRVPRWVKQRGEFQKRAGFALLACQAGHELTCHQSNAEHELVDKVHGAKGDDVRFIVFNPGAFTHTSIALRDALLGVGIPFIEVHLSNVHARESFRRSSFLSDVAVGVITGLGARGYELALQAAMAKLGDG